MLGDLSMFYETGFRPPDYLKAAAKVSDGRGDPGGRSYGAYQLASRVGTLQRFMTTDGLPWKARFQGLDPATDAYGAMWRKVAAEEGMRFFDAQHAFIKAKHYDKVVKAVLRDTAVDLEPRTEALRNAVWSAAVQHGRATVLIGDAIRTCQAARTIGDDLMLLRAMYARRLAYVEANPDLGGVIKGLRQRYADELAEALAAAEREGVKRLPQLPASAPAALPGLRPAAALPGLRPAPPAPRLGRGSGGSW